jgi:hypothetical protein
MSRFDNVSVVKKANVYFDGKCVSHTVQFADGSRKSIGVVMPATLTFNTGAAEVMEAVAGACRYRLKGGDWQDCGVGQRFSVAADSSFDIEVSGEPFHYVCHFGSD